MASLLKGRIKKPGLPPGSLVFTGEDVSAPVDISIINFNEKSLDEKQQVSLQDCEGLSDQSVYTWVNVNGLHDVSIIEGLGAMVDLHPLIMEALVNVDQRPRFEEHDAYFFIVMKMLQFSEDQKLKIEQVSFIVGDSYVISFQEYAGDVFEPVRHRLRHGKGRIRKLGADYLAYTLIDTIVDYYFNVIEQFGEHIESLEDRLIENPEREMLLEINAMKREVILLRKSVWPLREMLSAMQRSESPLIKKKTGAYLRDVYDHTIQVVDMAETFRDLLSSLTDLYMSSLSQKMNEVMQFLTIVGAIFIPLTFIAGVYGMNFQNMPELQWPNGYPIAMALMALIGGGLLLYFKQKRWL